MMQFDGPCPFVTCTVTVAHAHPICPDCGAVKYGNLYCKTCRATWGHWNPEHEAKYGASLDAARTRGQ